MKVKKQDVWFLVEKAFPDYKGKKFLVQPTETVSFHNLNWSGGTKNTYKALALSAKAKACSLAPWANPLEGQTKLLPKGCVVVKRTWTYGEEANITVFVHPEDFNSGRLEAKPSFFLTTSGDDQAAF